MSVSLPGQTQNIEVEAGTEIPLNYSIGIGYSLNENIQFNLRTGILTMPYDNLIISLLGRYATDESETNTIQDAFQFGVMAKAGINYKFSNFYTGAFYSFWRLQATDIPTDLLNNYFDLNLPPMSYDLIDYTLKSDLHNFGILIGKSFPLKEGMAVGTEFSISKTFITKNELSNNFDEMTLATGYVHDILDPLLMKYGFLPSINVFIRKNLTGIR